MFITKIDTFDELRSRVGNLNATIEVLGRTNINDGVGGVFYWDITSTESDDDLNIIQVDNIAEGRWIRLTTKSAGIPSLSEVTAVGNTTSDSIIGITEPPNENSNRLASTSWVNQKISSLPTQVNADWDSTSGISMILNKPVLATVAISGDYNNLINTPSITNIYNSDGSLTGDRVLTGGSNNLSFEFTNTGIVSNSEFSPTGFTYIGTEPTYNSRVAFTPSSISLNAGITSTLEEMYINILPAEVNISNKLTITPASQSIIFKDYINNDTNLVFSADNNGKLIFVDLPISTNIYNSNGEIPSGTLRDINLQSGASVNFNDANGGRLVYGENSFIVETRGVNAVRTISTAGDGSGIRVQTFDTDSDNNLLALPDRVQLYATSGGVALFQNIFPNRIEISNGPTVVSTIFNDGRLSSTRFNVSSTFTPTSSSDAGGVVGDLIYDSNYLYIKTAAGWKRSALAAF